MRGSSEKQSLWTVKDILEWTADYFTSKGIRTARLDAEVLLAHSLGVNRLHLYLNLDRPLLSPERSRFRALIQRRARREPVARIVGVKEFWSIPLRTPPGVLIPRPDTETLVEATLDEIKDKVPASVLEIGTGSGAVSVAVLKENPRARIVATDISIQALHVARLNAEDAGICSGLDFIAMDLFAAMRQGTGFDVICSNPPYIPSDDIHGLEPEVRDFEPILALEGGVDGLDVIRRLAHAARHHLAPNGALILEVGEGQADAVSEILRQVAGMGEIEVIRDLAGKQRVVKARP